MHVTMRGFMAAAAIGAVFIGGTLFLLRASPSSNVGGAPAVSQAPASPTPSPSPAPSASGPLTACGLVTSDEVEIYASSGSLGARPSESGTGDRTTCIYSDGGENIVLHLTYTSAGGRDAFESVQNTAGVQAVADIGTEAVYDPATATLYVAKGDALVGLRAGTSAQTPEVRLSKVRTLGELVAERM